MHPGHHDQRTERYDTIVIGGGQAGLAVGYHLAKGDVDYVILDGADRVGDSWRRRWDSLRLLTPAAFSGLPGLPFPARPAHLPDKDEVADYLERYAQRFDLNVRPRSHVTALRWNGLRYAIDTDLLRYEAARVVVATGPFQRARIPALAVELSPSIRQLHSSQYLNPFSLPHGDVLVVGAGNSGAQIALEVSRFRAVYLAGRRVGRLPRRFLGRDIHDWLWPVLSRLSRDRRLGRMVQRRIATDPLIGLTEADLAQAGITRTGRVTAVREGLPVADGAPLGVASVIWCTGAAPDFDWIHLPLRMTDRGMPTTRGAVSGAPGLYFVGLRYLHGPTSSLLGGVGADAEYIANELLRSRAGEC